MAISTLENAAAEQRAVEEKRMEDHKADLARRAQEREPKRDELRRCLNPAYAAQREHEKPHYRWTISASWVGRHDGEVKNISAEESVVAQTEKDAWAMFCDRIGTWPSRRDSKPTIKRGKQIASEAVFAAATAGVEVDATLPVVRIGAKAKARKL